MDSKPFGNSGNNSRYSELEWFMLDIMAISSNKGLVDRGIITNLEGLKAFLEENKFTYHHTALTRGYISRKSQGILSTYHGHFGRGFAIETPCTNGTQWHQISYYIYDEGVPKVAKDN